MNFQHRREEVSQPQSKYFDGHKTINRARLAMLCLAMLGEAIVEMRGAAASTSTTASVRLIPFRDPSPLARQRFWDIADRPYSAAFRRSFSYARADVLLRYERAPASKYFRGYLSARGLKPNFAYQMKLCGKPRDGSRGWKKWGDDVSNERIGRVARWWDDSDNRNADDWDFTEKYASAAPSARHSIYGYHFLGDFVTDERGQCEVEIEGRYSYHITWQSWQNGPKDVVAATWSIGSTLPPHGAYGERVEPLLVKLYYEWESKRPQEVDLPSGVYNCRLLITEETFHNPQTGTNEEHGGHWPTVLASEDFDRAGRPDRNSRNDIVFTIR